MKIIAITNQKGGVAKTTTAINLAAGLNKKGKKILLADLDPQHNLTVALGIEAHKLEYTVYDVLKNNINLDKAIIKRDSIDILPSSLKLSAADIEFSSIPGREFLLRDALKEVDNYNYILLDCPPSLGILTLNALSLATDVLIPVQTEFLALQGISMLIDTINVVKSRLNSKLNILGVLATRYDSRKNLSKEVTDYLKESFNEKLLKTYIHDNIALAESSSFGKTIFEYKPDSKGAEDYISLAIEIINLNNK
jgi:chromosome partitioning protein